MLLLIQLAVLATTVIVVVALSLPALMMATRGLPSVGRPMQTALLLTWLLQLYVTMWLAVTRAVDLLVAYGFVA